MTLTTAGEYAAIHRRQAHEWPWVCARASCQWARPGIERRPRQRGRCGANMIRGGPHLALVQIDWPHTQTGG